jgi:TonB-linked SusC/RagA family outer membrane protein
MKKFRDYDGRILLKFLPKKTIRVMKLTLLLTMVAVIQLWATETYSQLTQLTLKLDDVTISDALKEIENQSEFFFLYSPKLIDVEKKVNIDAEDETIKDILAGMFEKKVKFAAYDRQVILTPNEQSEVLSEFQQQKIITGTVTDKNGPIPGANVVVTGTTTGTITDFNGRYSLDIPQGAESLTFTFIGMEPKEVIIGTLTQIDVTMAESAIGLDEVVVIGYGTQRKATLTGAITSIKSEELTRSPVIGVSNSLSGLLPGVTVLNRSGEPGRDDAMVFIRGMSTTGNTSPLVVVDGIQGYTGWERINSNDIESISVLKDASAAIYGSRAANGVILITTKRGTVGKPTLSYSFSEGISQPTRIPEMASSDLYAEFVNDRLVMTGSQPKYTDAEIQKFKDGSDPNYPNTDWYGEVLKKVSLQSQHNLSIRGGTEDVQYLVSGSYSDQEGIFEKGSLNYKNYSLLGRVDGQINKNIKVGFDINAAMEDGNYPAYSTNSTFTFLGMNLPTEPIYWPNGQPSAGISAGNNPALMCTDATGNNNQRKQRYSTKASIDINIPWIEGLGVDGYFTYTNNTNLDKNWRLPWITNSYNITADEYTEVLGGGVILPRLTESLSSNRSTLINLRAKYDRQFNDHHISTFIALERSEGLYNNFSAFRKDYSSPALDQLFAGSLTGMSSNGSASESGRLNYFGRVSYGFQKKYLFDFNYRFDGSSNFPEDNRWGFFPGGSVAWRISEENFIQDNFGFIDNLKLRASYGQIGNDQVKAFQYLSTYSLGNYGYPFGISPVTTLGLIAGVTPNPFITWEVAEISNIGLDIILWNGLLDFTVDVFKQRRSNILAKRDLAVPFNTGLTLPNENIGIVENKGIELALKHSKVIGDISYRIGGNVSFVKNEVIDVSEPQNVPEWQKAEGHVLGADRFYNSLGIIRTQTELDAIPVVPGSVLGDLKYEDVDGDGMISDADMVRLDKTNTPQVVFGLNLSMAYKDFSLWAHFAGQTKVWQYFHKYSKEGKYNLLEDLLANRYTAGSMDSKYPLIPSSENETMDVSGFHSTFWLKDASFVRLKTLELSYDLSNNLLSKIKIASMRIFLNGNNLFTIDKLKWYDPEGSSTTGNFYPQSKIYNIGINISF